MESPMEKGLSYGAKGRDPSGLWVQYPNPMGTVGPALLTLTRTSAHVTLSKPTLIWAAKGDLRPHA